MGDALGHPGEGPLVDVTDVANLNTDCRLQSQLVGHE